MRRPKKAAAVLLAGLTLVGSATVTASAHPLAGGPRPYTFAVIGDIPYGSAQIAHFPKVVDQINADPDVQSVTHLGDIKSGSSLCTDEYFASIRTQFDRFEDPMIYTPGDNEWTDCHRANNGSYNPLERLAKIRQVFFDHPGRTLGQHSVPIPSQSRRGLPENVGYQAAGVTFAAAHIVGSNNSLAPWTGQTAPTPEQLAEEKSRTDGDLDLIKTAFAAARVLHSKAVVLFTQADMFDPTVPNPNFADYSAFKPIVELIAAETARFGKPVYLFNGDSHVYNGDNPLAAGSTWLDFYGLPAAGVPNFNRVTIDGSTAVGDYLRVTVGDDAAHPVSWVKVPFVPPV
jgi:hypothetical protein